MHPSTDSQRDQASIRRVLCVDDDPQYLRWLKVHLDGRFSVETARDGASGLKTLENSEPFAVVIADLKMPRMDGVNFLTAASELAKETTRVLLTGRASLDEAVAAVNDAGVFRFLLKPCQPRDLIAATNAAVEYHRLLTAERSLLENTLRGSIEILMEVLALASPDVFGRAHRVRERVARVARLLDQPAWAVEIAATFLHAACITLPSDLFSKAVQGEALTQADQDMIHRVPKTAEKFARSIPRLESVQEILRDLPKVVAKREPADRDGSAACLGARILQGAIDLGVFEERGVPSGTALEAMRRERTHDDADVLAALESVLNEQSVRDVVRELQLDQLRPGMSLVEDVLATDNRLLVARGQRVTVSLVERLRNFEEQMGLKQPIRVLTEN